MMAIFKYKLPDVAKPGAFELELPKGAVVLEFGEDLDAHLCIWAWVSPDQATVEKREFILAWTGTRIDGGVGYHGRAVHGGLIWHLLESVGVGVAIAALMNGTYPRYGRLLP
jgi:hypothetical protein